MNPSRPQARRVLAVWVGLALSGVLLARLARPALVEAHVALHHAGPSDPGVLPAVVVGLCAGSALLAWAWLAIGTVCCAVADALGAPAPTWTPRLARILTATALGAGLVGVPTAQAAPGPTLLPAATLSGLRVPDRTTGRPVTVWTVRPGDTLWAVATALLPPGRRDPGTVDRTWRQVYDRNRGVIGTDPDLLHPGQRLALLPAPTPHRGGSR